MSDETCDVPMTIEMMLRRCADDLGEDAPDELITVAAGFLRWAPLAAQGDEHAEGLMREVVATLSPEDFARVLAFLDAHGRWMAGRTVRLITLACETN
jgi:hypothetical protein